MYETYLFALVWVVAFAATVARSISDADRSGWIRRAGFGATAGFLSVGVIAVWSGSSANGGGHIDARFAVGVAALIGGLGKEQDRIRVVAWNMLTHAIRAIEATDKKDGDK